LKNGAGERDIGVACLGMGRAYGLFPRDENYPQDTHNDPSHGTIIVGQHGLVEGVEELM